MFKTTTGAINKAAKAAAKAKIEWETMIKNSINGNPEVIDKMIACYEHYANANIFTQYATPKYEATGKTPGYYKNQAIMVYLDNKDNKVYICCNRPVKSQINPYGLIRVMDVFGGVEKDTDIFGMIEKFKTNNQMGHSKFKIIDVNKKVMYKSERVYKDKVFSAYADKHCDKSTLTALKAAKKGVL